MRSAVVLSEEVDDIELSVAELVAGIRSKLGELDRSSVGILCCDADADVASIGALLHEELGCDIIGLTVTAMMSRDFGYSSCGVLLTIHTGDDVDISVGYTGPLAGDSCEDQISDAWRGARAALPSDPKLILLCAPFVEEILPERYINTFDELSESAPIFGGAACDFFTLDHPRVMRNGEADKRSLAFVLISGNIDPVFAVCHRIGEGSRRRATITKAHGNVVEELDGEPFGDFAEDIVLMPGDVDASSVAFIRQSTPFVVSMPDAVPGEVDVARPLFDVDAEMKSGKFICEMPVGASVTISSMNKEHILGSCEDALDALFKRMDESGREFSTLLTSVCNARALILGANKPAESRILQKKLRERDSLDAMGAYVFGEFCPTCVTSDGKVKNRFHNLTFAVCAF